MKTLSVLIVEDSDDDFELLSRELRKGPYTISSVRAQCARSFKEALKQHKFDVILSDYAMSGFTALDVLKILADLELRIPCIIVSGTIGEETAVELMKAGAKDYLLKDRMSRLNNAIEREVARGRSDHARDLLSKASHDALWDWNLADNTVHWNEGLRSLLGYDMPGMSTSSSWWMENLHPDDRERVLGIVDEALKEGRDTWTCEYRFRRHDGTYASVLDRGYMTRNASGATVRALGAMIDLSPLKQAERQVMQREFQLKQAQHVARMGSFELDVATMASTFSDEMCEICEVPVGSVITAEERLRLIHPEDYERAIQTMTEAMKYGSKYQLDYRICVPSGIKYIHSRAEPVFSENGALIKYLGIGQDVTERALAEQAIKQREDQLRQLQKMDAIGTLAGGIAHDYNNMLAAIQMNCELALQDKGEMQREDLEQILSIVTRGASLTRQLLLFSRKQPRIQKVFNLNESIRHMEKMLYRLIGETIEFQTKFDPALWLIEADPGQIDQVLMNLVVNARDAMPNGGKISIETRNISVGKDLLQGQVQHLKPGPYVQLSVVDTGSGMSPEIQNKIFEPFFTTKPVGQGTGIGLSTVYGILMDHGGAISVYSEVAKGSVFNVFLRASKDHTPLKSETTVEIPSFGVSGACVLLVEDEHDLRKSLEKLLIQQGFKVLTAQDGQAALALFKLHEADIDLLVSDVTMPNMGGHALMQEARKIKPGLPVILMSGYAGNQLETAVSSEIPAMRFVAKPFSSSTLITAVQALLSSP